MRLVLLSATMLYASTVALVIVSFTTEYNLAQAVVFVFVGSACLGLAVALTVFAGVLWLRRVS